LRDPACGRTEPLAPRLVLEQRRDGIRKRLGIPRRDEQTRLVGHDVTVPADVGGNHGRRAGERPRQHHPETLAAERRGHQGLRAQQLLGEIVLTEEPERVDPCPVDPCLLQPEPHHQRVGAHDSQPCARAAVDLRPRAQQDRHALPPVVPADEDDPVLAPARLGVLGDQHPVRDHLELAADPARRRLARRVGDRYAPVDPVHQKPPYRQAGVHPAQPTGGVEGRDDRAAGRRHHRGADHRGHRLVKVHHVEALALEHALDLRHGAGAEHDIRQRAVRGHDHRAADRDHVTRWLAVAPVPRVQHPGEAPRRVVADDRPRLDPEPLQRVGLELGVLEHGSPVGPRVRDDYADLHRPAILTKS